MIHSTTKRSGSLPILLLLICFLRPGTAAFAQSNQVLAAPRVSGLITLGVTPDGKTLRMSGNSRQTDVLNFDNAAPFKGDLILLKNAGYNLSYRTVNPLRYQVSAKRTGIESDEFQKAIQSIMSDVTTIISTVSGGSLPGNSATDFATETSVTKEKLQAAWERAYPAAAKWDNQNSAAYTPVLRDPELKKSLTALRLMLPSNSHVHSASESLAAEVVKAEKYARFDYLAKAVPLVRRLFLVDFTNTHAEAELLRIRKEVHELDSMNKLLASAIDTLTDWKAMEPTATSQDAVANPSSLRANPIPLLRNRLLHTMDKDPADWLNQSKEAAVKNLTTMRDARVSMQKELQELTDYLWREKGEVDASGNRVQPIYSATLPTDSIVRLAITVKERWFEVDKNLNMTAKDSLWYQRDVRLMKTHSFYPQVFPAVVFSDISFSKFTIQTDSVGHQTVSDGGQDRKPLLVAGMVNFNIKMGTRQEVPFIQLGASFKKSRPMFFTGVGCRFTEWFGISGGVLFSWRPELNSLEVGDEVKDQAELDRDITYQWAKPTFYLSFQVRPNTLTTIK